MSAGGGGGGNSTNGVGGTASGGDLNYDGETATSVSAGKNGLARRFTSNILTIGPFTALMVNAVSSNGVTTGSSVAGTAGMAVIEYTTTIT
jgi:hypothetical protein